MNILPIVGQLKGDLDVSVWAHFLFLNKLLPIVVEFVDINVQIIHQSERTTTRLAMNTVCFKHLVSRNWSEIRPL